MTAVEDTKLENELAPERLGYIVVKNDKRVVKSKLDLILASRKKTFSVFAYFVEEAKIEARLAQ